MQHNRITGNGKKVQTQGIAIKESGQIPVGMGEDNARWESREGSIGKKGGKKAT